MNKIIFDFIWKGKDKVKRSALVGDIEDGGLKAPHLYHRPECYCLRRHVFTVPSFSMRGIIIALIKLSEFRLFSSMNRWLSITGSNV